MEVAGVSAGADARCAGAGTRLVNCRTSGGGGGGGGGGGFLHFLDQQYSRSKSKSKAHPTMMLMTTVVVREHDAPAEEAEFWPAGQSEHDAADEPEYLLPGQGEHIDPVEVE
jgi:hypothetical protein